MGEEMRRVMRNEFGEIVRGAEEGNGRDENGKKKCIVCVMKFSIKSCAPIARLLYVCCIYPRLVTSLLKLNMIMKENHKRQRRSFRYGFSG